MTEKHEYMLVGLRRKKDNANKKLSAGCHRVLVNNNDMDYALKRLASLCKSEEGEWRVYRSVNKRNLNKALKLLQCELVMRGDEVSDRVDTLWKSLLMKPTCKSEKKFLLDVDDKSVNLQELMDKYLPDCECELYNSPNGYHLVVPGFDTRELLKEYAGQVEVKKDALVYLHTLKV